MSFRADIHCHSSFSDGILMPEELLHLAKDVGLQGLSITDHDTIDAYSKELFSLARSLEIELLPGVEISSEWKDQSVHILGYGVDLNSELFQEMLREIQRRRQKRNREILAKLAEKGMEIREEDLLAYAEKCNKGRLSSVGRPHIAALLQEKGYVSSYMDAFRLYLKDGGSCYVPACKFSSKEIIEKIQEAKGKAILAHPHQISCQKILKSLLELNFDGLEGRYPRILLSEEKKWISLAKEKGWILTAGSDFHGPERGHVSLGCCSVDKAVFDQLRR
jgi:3',5'-nucleoside bisphosphate phosphatase